MRRNPTDQADDFFARMLSGQTPTTGDIDLLIACGAPEGLHLDYKSGLIASRSKKAFQDEIQREVAGFANSDGGVVVFGIRERDHTPGQTGPGVPEKVEGLTMGEDAVRDVVRDALVSLRPYLSSNVSPQFLQHGADLLLVLAVARSDSLVLVRGDNKSHIHYLRIHDSTDPAPGYLVEDLILGRRRKPSPRAVLSQGVLRSEGDAGMRLELTLVVHNEGLVWMDDVRAGIVGLGRHEPPATWDGDSSPYPPPIDNLGMHIQGRRQAERAPNIDPFYYGKSTDSGPTIGPLSGCSLTRTIQLPALADRDVWGAAVFVVSRDQSPRWWQLVVYNGPGGATVQLLPLGHRRAKVGLAHQNVTDWCRVEARDGKLVVELAEEQATFTPPPAQTPP